jgi:hypothetical protein
MSPNAVLDSIVSGSADYAQLLGVPEATLAALERYGASMFRVAKYERAAQTYSLLARIEASRPLHWLRLALSEFRRGDRVAAQSALACYRNREARPTPALRKAADDLERLIALAGTTGPSEEER